MFKQAAWALENKMFEYATEVLSGGSDRLKVRNELIGISDTSEGEYETMR